MAITREKPVLEEKLKTAHENISKLEKQVEASEQAIKVKNKMLEDQNESIKKLKQNLENKVGVLSTIYLQLHSIPNLTHRYESPHRQ